MTEFILLRHTDTDYSVIRNASYKLMNGNIAFLSEKGILHAKELAKEPVLLGADMLISSPYTRTMQTASYISLETNLPINVEFNLHEWIPDVKALTCDSDEKIKNNYNLAINDYIKCEFPNDRPYESLKQTRERIMDVLEKYLGYSKVIVVTHGGVLYSLTGKRFEQGEYMKLSI